MKNYFKAQNAFKLKSTFINISWKLHFCAQLILGKAEFNITEKTGTVIGYALWQKDNKGIS